MTECRTPLNTTDKDFMQVQDLPTKENKEKKIDQVETEMKIGDELEETLNKQNASSEQITESEKNLEEMIKVSSHNQSTAAKSHKLRSGKIWKENQQKPKQINTLKRNRQLERL